MDTKATAKWKGTISAVVTRANGTVEDLGVIATTEDQSPPPGIVRQLRDAWAEGWHEGTGKGERRKDDE